MKIIVVLTGTKGFISRSWRCYENGEAERMVRWLDENEIKAKALTIEEWNTAADTDERERQS